MAKKGFFKGEGGHVWEMDLPLSEQHARAVEEGRLVPVQPVEAPLPEEPEAQKTSGRKRASKAPSKEQE